MLLSEVVAGLRQLVGEQHVLTDNASKVLYAQDVYAREAPAGAVIQPQSVTALSQAVKFITEAGFAVLPRGGGMSYTKGLVPVELDTVIVDMSGLNNIVEINTQDMYVTVQAGCTWKALHEALAQTGYRTPYWGTLSGIRATVGGGLSQNAIFWGSGQYGFSVDSVLSVSVCLADGTILDTGSAAQVNGTPFMRHFGPDLTGLFCCDNSALGIKTDITLRLVPTLPHRDGVSFCFRHFEQQAAVMSEVARQNLVTECCGFDPYLQAQRLKRESLTADMKSLGGVFKSANGLGDALKRGAKVALAGRNFVEADAWSVHFWVEDRTQAGIDDKLNAIRKIAAAHQATEVANTIPTILRGTPFGPVNNMIGPNGERWAPVHTLVPHSKAVIAYQETEAVFARHRASIDKYTIGIGYLLALVSTNVFVLEPVFFWPDELHELHHFAIDPGHIKKVKGFSANPEATKAVQAIREDLIALYSKIGGVHMQVGKTYAFKDGIVSANFALLKHLKQYVDPNNRINPTVLSL